LIGAAWAPTVAEVVPGFRHDVWMGEFAPKVTGPGGTTTGRIDIYLSGLGQPGLRAGRPGFDMGHCAACAIGSEKGQGL
jgi:hypothetical protein